MNKTRVLIVDDSATMRGLLSAILSRDPQIEVVGAAPDAAAARQLIRQLNPDVVTLDVEMPNMNGLEFLERIMRLRPIPVVMVSTLTQKGAEVTLSALEIGAVDCFAKPTDRLAANLAEREHELCEKVKMAASARVRPYVRRDAPVILVHDDFDPGTSIVAIGSSTGGVEALIQVLSHYPENCPPTVITQHMPARFTTSFAQRLDSICRPSVTEAKDGCILSVGSVYLAPGGETHLEIYGTGTLRCRLSAGSAVNGHRPSVDVLFESVAAVVGERGIGAILTGMGRDGASGLLSMRKRGAATIGQDEASSIVYGMPRVAFEMGAVEKQVPLERIGPEILDACRARAQRGMCHARSS